MTEDQFRIFLTLIDEEWQQLYVFAGRLLVNCNDYFAPAADAEEITFAELPELLEIVRNNPELGALQWVAKKRGIPCRHWRAAG